MKKTVLFLLILFILLSLAVGHVTAEKIVASGKWSRHTWTLDSNGLLTISGTGKMANAFSVSSGLRDYKKQIRSVEVCEGVTAIGEWAFADYPALETVILHPGLVSIGRCAFSGCKSLKNINIPEGLREIGDSAFSNCVSLESIGFPDSIRKIEFCTFQGCSNLRKVTLPAGLKTIRSDLFRKCVSLTDIVIPDAVKTIERHAFEECSSLNDVVIPGSVSNLDPTAFHECTSLTDLTVSPSSKKFSSVDGVVFTRDQKTLVLYPAGRKDRAYAIPDGVTGIGKYAFYECESLEELTIPASFSKADAEALYFCRNLKTIRYLGTPDQLDRIDVQESYKGVGELPWYCGAQTAQEIPGEGTSAAESPQAGQPADIPALNEKYTGKETNLRKPGQVKNVTQFAGPVNPNLVVKRLPVPTGRSTMTVYFVENDMVFVRNNLRSGLFTIYHSYGYIRKDAVDLKKLKDVPEISELPYVAGKTKEAVVPLTGPGKEYTEWALLTIPADTAVRCYFTADGYCFAEFDSDRGPARVWIESGMIVADHE